MVRQITDGDYERMMIPREKRYLTIPEAAERYGFGRSTIYLWCSQGLCPRLKLGRSVRIPVDEFERWLGRHVEGGTATDPAHRDSPPTPIRREPHPCPR